MNRILQLVLLFTVFINYAFGQSARTTYDGYEYEIAASAMTWADASAFAKSQGGTLVKIGTIEQNSWLP